MKIGSISENLEFEKRIAITPEIVKKYTALGFQVYLIENYASHLGIKDEYYKDVGANISKDEAEVLNYSDIIVQLGIISDDKLNFRKNGEKTRMMRLYRAQCRLFQAP